MTNKCSFCGEHFSSSFEKAKHLTVDGSLAINPKFYLNERAFIELGTLLERIYRLANDPEHIRTIVDEAYGVIIDAEEAVYELHNMIEEKFND